MSARRRRQTRVTTVRVRDFGITETDDGFDLTRWEGSVRKVVHVKLETPADAEWLATYSLKWLKKRRENTVDAIESIEIDAQAARGKP